MKISNEQLRAIQEQEVQRSKGQKGVQQGDFTDLLARHLEADTQSPSAVTEKLSAPAGGVSLPVTGILEDSATTAAPFLEEAANAMEGMFDTLDGYALQLAGSEPGNLKEAYSLLQNMNGQIADFKQRFPGAAEEQPELAAMVNELDVLATTETFKFNRGDYL